MNTYQLEIICVFAYLLFMLSSWFWMVPIFMLSYTKKCQITKEPWQSLFYWRICIIGKVLLQIGTFLA